MDDLERELTEGELRETRLRAQRDEARRALELAGRRSPPREDRGPSVTALVVGCVLAALFLVALRSCPSCGGTGSAPETKPTRVAVTLTRQQPPTCPTSPSGCVCPIAWADLPDVNRPDVDAVSLRGAEGMLLVDKVIMVLNGQGLNMMDLEDVREVLTGLVREERPWKPAVPSLQWLREQDRQTKPTGSPSRNNRR